MSDICGDNRFELIEKYKKELIEATNIETAPDEMAVIDDILFRFWQMGWLDKLDLPSAQPEPLTVTIDYEPSKDVYDRLKQAMRDAPILLLPPAQPAPRWIPVSERLPEDDDIVLITMDDSITVRGEFFEQISNELGFFKEGVWHWGYEIGEAYWPETTHVTAWLPLPEPYKEENR